MAIIHIIDDDSRVCDTIKLMLQSDEWEVFSFHNPNDALKILHHTPPDIIITNYHLQNMTGLELLNQVHLEHPEIEIIIITEIGDHNTALDVMRAGAYDYIKKPLDIKELRLVVERGIQSKKIGDKLSYLYNQQHKLFGFGELIGRSKEMKRIFKIIRMVSESRDTPVVIVGDTGTGKEMVARSIHSLGSRNTEAFVSVNCAAIQENLLEPELFGYEQGAFTDARRSKRGLMEVASGGTFFLDEIASMDMGLQVKLLKAIEEKKVRRVGGVKDIPVDIRVIASSNKPLEELIEKGLFREDLYYRLNVITVVLPPLKDRGSDILILANHFIEKFNEDFKCNVSGITEEAQKLLLNQEWPGNVRELRNIIERAVLLKKSGEIDTHHLFLAPAHIHNSRSISLEDTRIFIPDDGIDFEDLEQKYLEAALKKAEGNKSKAAKLLGMSRNTFRYRLEKYSSK